MPGAVIFRNRLLYLHSDWERIDRRKRLWFAGRTGRNHNTPEFTSQAVFLKSPSLSHDRMLPLAGAKTLAGLIGPSLENRRPTRM